MPKIKIPKNSPSIDMTPMVDLAFLLVTFFMLNANFRSDEPVQVDTPSSISDKEIPDKSIIVVTVDDGGRVFYNCSGEETKKIMLKNMMAKYKVGLNEKQIEQFSYMSSFGCKMSELSAYIDATPDERKKFPTMGIPADTTESSELKDWINFGNRASLETGKVAYEEASMNQSGLNVNDFKPKFILKVDSKAKYVYAKTVIDVFRDLNLNNLNFVTSMEANPNQKPKP